MDGATRQIGDMGAKKHENLVRKAVAAERERCAKMIEGSVFKERYRTWQWYAGNRSVDSELVKFCDAAASAIRNEA